MGLVFRMRFFVRFGFLFVFFSMLALPCWAQRIDKVFHSATSVLRPGDDLQVIVTGTGGGQAEFEILGKTKKLPMQETQFGRYEAHWTIPRGLDVDKGIVLVTLTQNAQQTTEEANRLISVDSNQGQTAAAPTIVVSPQGSVQAVRPVVRVEFPEPIRTGSTSLFVDGVNFSRQVRTNAQVMTWTPAFDLSLGRHKVEVEARALNGGSLAQNWTFDTVAGGMTTTPPVSGPINPPSVPPSNPPSAPTLTVTNLSDGMTLGPNFNVAGRGVPGSTVRVSVEHPRADFLSRLAGEKLRFQGQALVAADGTYSVNLDAGPVKRGDAMDITVTDSANSPAKMFTTKRGNSTQTTGGTTSAGAMTFAPSPPDGTTINSRRPRIGSTFDQRASKAKLVIDGRDFTQQAKFAGNEIFWDAQWDLDFSRHNATVTTWVNGVQQSQSWSFRIDKATVAPTSGSGSQAFFDSQNGFGLTIPFGWIQATPSQNTALKLTRGSQTSLEVGIAPNSNDVAGMVTKLRTAFIQQGMSLDSETQNSLGGFPSTVLDFTKANGGAALAIVAAANNKLYVIGVDSDVPGDPAVKKEVDDMLSSFVIR